MFCATNEIEDGETERDVPLVRAMVAMATLALRHIVVRAPLLVMLEERQRIGKDGPVHELVARTGMLLRGPSTLLRRQWRTHASDLGHGAYEPGGGASDAAGADPGARRA